MPRFIEISSRPILTPIQPGTSMIEIEVEFMSLYIDLSKDMAARDVTWGLCMIGVNLLLGVQSMLLNFFIIRFYKTKNGNVPHIYVLLSSCDFFVGISAVLNLLTFICYLSTDSSLTAPSAATLYLQISAITTYFVSSIAIRVSIFINIILAVVRTINIISSSVHVNIRFVDFSVVIYALIWTVITACDVYAVAHRVATKDYQCENCVYMWHFMFSPLSGYWWVVKSPLITADNHEAAEVYLAYVFLIGPFLLPATIAIICMILQSYKLFRKQNVRLRLQREVTMSIFYATFVFFVFYSTTTIVSMAKFTQLSNHQGAEAGQVYYRLCYFLYSLMPIMNAAVNPWILIIRGASLQRSTIRYIRKLRRIVSCRKDGSVTTPTNSVDISRRAVIIMNESTLPTELHELQQLQSPLPVFDCYDIQ